MQSGIFQPASAHLKDKGIPKVMQEATLSIKTFFASVNKQTGKKIIIDSGASKNICSAKKMFKNTPQNLAQPIKVFLPNCDYLLAKDAGTVISLSASKGEKGLALQNTLYIPQFQGNVISISKLTDFEHVVDCINDVRTISKDNDLELQLSTMEFILYRKMMILYKQTCLSTAILLILVMLNLNKRELVHRVLIMMIYPH